MARGSNRKAVAGKKATLELSASRPVRPAAATGGVCRSQGYSRGDEQMGRSLLRVGVRPKQTDREVDEGREGRKAGIGALIQGESEDWGDY